MKCLRYKNVHFRISTLNDLQGSTFYEIKRSTFRIPTLSDYKRSTSKKN